MKRMKKIRVYRHPRCARCARFARVAHFLDWFGRVDHSTEEPKTGPLRMGEVVVEELPDGRIHGGAEGIELIWQNIPAYAPFRPLLKVPAIRRYVDKEVSGCNDNGCSL
jgi:hypothetical protein